MTHFNDDPNAPTVVLVVHVATSAINSAFVGSLYPEGQGLLMPAVPCHKLLFWGTLQSQGEANVFTNNAFGGVFDEQVVVVTPLTGVPRYELAQVMHWWLSARRPHW